MVLDQKEKNKVFDAAEKNDLETIKFFVEEKGASIQMLNDDLETLAHVAARNGNTDVLKYVASKNPSLLADKSGHGNSVFYMANQKGAIDIVKYLIEEHLNNISRSELRNFFSAAMHTAAEFGHLEILKYFVEQKQVDVNVLNSRHESPVITATEYKHHPIVKYLVEERGADLTVMDINHANILFATIGTNDLALIKYFLDERKVDIDVNWQDRFGNTVLHRAALMNRTQIIEYLVDKKHADVNIAGYENMTPLHYAASGNYYKICKYLIEHGANMQYKDDFGHIPIEKTFDKQLIEYMRSAASAARNRRDVYLSSISSECTQRKMNADNSLTLARESDRKLATSFREIYQLDLQNFFIVAGLFARTAKRTGYEPNFPSPSEILQKKMDSSVENAIHSLPDFTKSREWSFPDNIA